MGRDTPAAAARDNNARDTGKRAGARDDAARSSGPIGRRGEARRSPVPVYEPPLRPGNGGKYVWVLGTSQSEQETFPHAGVHDRPCELPLPATSKPDAATGPAQLTGAPKIRPSNGIRRNTAALQPERRNRTK